MRLRLFPSAGALARLANDILRACKPGRLPLVKLLETYFVLLLLVRTLAWPARTATTHAAHTWHTAHAAHATAHTKHLRQQVVQIYVTAHTAGTRPAAVESGHAMGIVYFAFLIVEQDFVGL